MDGHKHPNLSTPYRQNGHRNTIHSTTIKKMAFSVSTQLTGRLQFESG